MWQARRSILVSSSQHSTTRYHWKTESILISVRSPLNEATLPAAIPQAWPPQAHRKGEKMDLLQPLHCSPAGPGGQGLPGSGCPPQPLPPLGAGKPREGFILISAMLLRSSCLKWCCGAAWIMSVVWCLSWKVTCSRDRNMYFQSCSRKRNKKLAPGESSSYPHLKNVILSKQTEKQRFLT